MNLPGIDESGVYTFESVDQVPIEKGWEYEPSEHSEIDQELAPRNEVLEVIVTSRELASGANLDGAIARISREIEDLRAQVGDEPVNGLELKLGELKSQTRTALYKKQPARGLPSGPSPQPLETKADYSELEARLALLENKIGHQQPPVALATVLRQLGRKVELLSLQPEKIQESVAMLQVAQKGIVTDKVEAVYNRLESLGPLLDDLPQIVQRLKTLELLHVDSAATQSFAKDAEGTLRQMKSDIERWNERLDKIEASLDTKEPAK